MIHEPIFQVGVTALIIHNKTKGEITSLSLFVFWLLYAVATGIRYRSALLGAFHLEVSGAKWIRDMKAPPKLLGVNPRDSDRSSLIIFSSPLHRVGSD